MAAYRDQRETEEILQGHSSFEIQPYQFESMANEKLVCGADSDSGESSLSSEDEAAIRPEVRVLEMT